MVKLLDHGSLELVESWGSDESIIRAARMSTDKGFLGWEPEWKFRCPKCPDWICIQAEVQQPKCSECKSVMVREVGHPGDEKLLRFLWEHKHLTPFEMAGAIFEVQAPIFVFREWHRHRTQSYNELSARYTPIPDVNYVPTEDRLGLNIGKTVNKQALGLFQGDLLQRFGTDWLKELKALYEQAEDVYQRGLNMGVPKELARLVVPVGRYSRMRAAANLRNWLSFLTLRNDDAAQYEIQVYAQAAQEILKETFPRTLALFEEERMAA